jgi:CheY-like chemotaxis protein
VAVRAGKISGRNITLEFDVSDTGIGIKQEKCYYLFEAFAQADGSTTRKYGGTGLGLAICRNIVKMMNGSISVESDEGQGSKFMFNVELEKEFGSQLFSSKALEKVKNLSTLVVENNRSLQKAVKRMLESFGFVAGIAETGQAALSVLEFNMSFDETPLGLMLIDAELPDMSGVELARKIHEKAGELSPRIILMGGAPSAINSSFSDYDYDINFIPKPVKPSVLFDKVMDIFGDNVSVSDEKVEKNSVQDVFKGMSVLLVEDNPVNQMVAKEMLSIGGVSVSIAENGLEAVALLEKNSFDAVLMDIQMPEMDGFEATSIIRNKLGLQDIPIIAMTAHAMQGDKEKCLDAGMNYYIAKPIDNKTLFGTLAKCKAEHALQKNDNYASDFTLVDCEVPYRLDGINVNEGIGRMEGNIDKYFEIVDQFCSHFRTTPELIRNALGNNDGDSIKSLVHSIKGAAGNISADTVREIAELMEKAYSSEDFDLIEKLTFNMEDAIERLILSIELVLPRPEIIIDNPLTNDDFNPEIFKKLVQKLDMSLEEYDPADSRIHFDEVQKYFTTSLNVSGLKGLWRKLETSIYVYQFDEARGYISEIKSLLEEMLEESA